MYQCYHTPTTLFFGNYRIYSKVRVQQGDPSGPLVFSEAIHPIIEAIKTELNVWFLDDGTLIGDIDTVKNDLITIKEKFKQMGLEINIDKCELFIRNKDEEWREEIQSFIEKFPDKKVIHELKLLGAPLSPNAVESVFLKKINELELVFSSVACIL